MSCVETYLTAGFTLEMAQKLCANAPKDPTPSDPSPVPDKAGPRTKNDYGLVPIGRTTSRASARTDTLGEGSMSSMGGRGWKLRTGYMGSGAVVFPDTDKEASSFLKSLGRPLTDKDLPGWKAYADRLGMPKDAVERAWKAMSKKELRPGLAETVKTLEAVFEATSWWGYSIPNLHMIKMRHGPPNQTPDPEPEPPKMGPIAAPEPSFPFHTKVSRKIYEKAMKYIRLFPLDTPGQILKRAVTASGATPMIDITPEDEKLLRMAIEFAQNGPAKSPGNKIGGMPGGPFNSTGGPYMGKRGAP